MNKEDKKKIGLALSGGGYRAAAYHLGTLRKLQDLNILDKVDVISAVSGGAIIAGSYGLHKGDFKTFEKELKEKLMSESIIAGLIYSQRFLLIILSLLACLFLICFLLFTDLAWMAFLILIIMLVVLIRFQFQILPVSKIIARLYDDKFYKKATLKDLCESPLIAINATNLDTGRPFTFSKKKMSDSSYIYRKDANGNDLAKIEFKTEDFPIANAVAASSCVPFAFTPIVIDKKHYRIPAYHKEIKPLLIDGGVYDNQGIHKLTQTKSMYECDLILVSDAGNKLPDVAGYPNTISLLIRTSDLFMNRIKNFQMFNNLFNKKHISNKVIAYQSLGWNYELVVKDFVEGIKKDHWPSSVLEAHKLDKEALLRLNDEELIEKIKDLIRYNDLEKNFLSERELDLARSVSTNLTALSEAQITALSRHAAILTEIQIKLYFPSLLSTNYTQHEK